MIPYLIMIINLKYFFYKESNKPGDTIKDVFKNYNQNDIARELIVKVPQIIAEYGLKELEHVTDLVKYYRDHVMKECNEFAESSLLTKQNFIIKLNKLNENFELLRYSYVELKNPSSEKWDSILGDARIQLVTSNSVLLSRLNIRKYLESKDYDQSSINCDFKEIRNLLQSKKLNRREEVVEILKSKQCKFLVIGYTEILKQNINSSDTYDQDAIQEILKLVHSREKCKVVFISDENESKKVKEHIESYLDKEQANADTFQRKAYSIEARHDNKFDDFSEKTQEMILKKEILFQGKETTIETFFKSESIHAEKQIYDNKIFFEFDLMAKLIESEKLVYISKEVSEVENYIDRNLKINNKIIKDNDIIK